MKQACSGRCLEVRWRRLAGGKWWVVALLYRRVKGSPWKGDTGTETRIKSRAIQISGAPAFRMGDQHVQRSWGRIDALHLKNINEAHMGEAGAARVMRDGTWESEGLGHEGFLSHGEELEFTMIECHGLRMFQQDRSDIAWPVVPF